MLALKAAADRTQRPIVVDHRDLFRRPLDTADLDDSDDADSMIDAALLDSDDDEGDDDDDEIVHDPLIIAALDALMFADAPPFALDNQALQAWYERLRAV